MGERDMSLWVSSQIHDYPRTLNLEESLEQGCPLSGGLNRILACDYSMSWGCLPKVSIFPRKGNAHPLQTSLPTLIDPEGSLAGALDSKRRGDEWVGTAAVILFSYTSSPLHYHHKSINLPKNARPLLIPFYESRDLDYLKCPIGPSVPVRLLQVME